MSWETDYSTTLPALDGDTIRKAARTAAELCPIEQLPEALQMLGIVATPGRKVTDILRRTVTTSEVLRLHDAGHSPTAIGRMLGISRSTVWHHIHKGTR